jgi:hypothetical protein
MAYSKFSCGDSRLSSTILESFGEIALDCCP